MHKNFSFKGVVRSNDNVFTNEGECLELVNLRMVNGSLRPIPEVEEVAVLPHKFSRIYWHDKALCFICIKSNSPDNICFYDSNWNPMLDADGCFLNFPLLNNVNSIEFLGYIVVCFTEYGVRYIVFANGTYRWLGESPVVPRMSVNLSSKLYEITTDSAFTQSYIDTDISSTWVYNSRGYFDECISKANKAGYYVDRALYRFALRLYDGSYIYSSHIIYVSDDNKKDGVSRDVGNLIAYPVNSSVDESRYRVSVLAFKPEFEFSNLELENWDGIVVGIDVFTTGSILGKKVGTATSTLLNTETKQYTTEKYEVYMNKELDELWNDVNNASLFYKIAEYDINGKLLHSVDDVSQSNVVLQDALSSFEQRLSYSSIVPCCSYMFNNRLHIASLREYFFKGYDSFSFLHVGAETAVVDKIAVMVRIKTQNGVSDVVNTFYNVDVAYSDGTFQFPPLMAYPDSRAFEMRMFVVKEGSTYMKILPLTPHKFLNQSQYLHKWYLGYDATVKAVFASGKEASGISKEEILEIFNEEVGVHEVIYSTSKGCWTYKGAAFPPEEYSGLRIFQTPRDVVDGDKLVFTITVSTADATFRDISNIPFDDTWQLVEDTAYTESNVYEEKENVLKVSMVDNPFVFPAKCTYSSSYGKIQALSTNRALMSEGQFGEHPLYLFSNEGIEVMAVDASGATAYSNMFPVSHEICRNPDIVCGTDSGVIFLGMQGLILISGSKCMRISLAMDNHSKELETITRSGIISRIASLYGVESAVDTIHFDDFMRNAKAVRLSETDEMLFCNSYYNYSFVYSASANVWSKINNAFEGFFKSGSKVGLFSHNGENTHIYVQGNSFTGKNKVLLVTRPYMFGTKLPKRIMQLMLHAYLCKSENGNVDMPFISCFLLCSNDGVHFKLVTACEKVNETQDVVFPYFPTGSYRYYIFALAGELNVNSMISGLEIDVNSAWSNRLR